MKREWPEGFHCVERTLDIELPWGGLTARVWFDGKSEQWNVDKMVELAQSVKRTEHWRQAEPQRLLNWLSCLPGVNAVQVYRSGPGYKIGVMAYIVPFETEETFYETEETFYETVRAECAKQAPPSDEEVLAHSRAQVIKAHNAAYPPAYLFS